MDEKTFKALLNKLDKSDAQIAIAIVLIAEALREQPGFDAAAFASKLDEATPMFPWKKFWLLRAIIDTAAGKLDEKGVPMWD